MSELTAIRDELRPIIEEMRREGVNGWPNALSEMAARLTALIDQQGKDSARQQDALTTLQAELGQYRSSRLYMNARFEEWKDRAETAEAEAVRLQHALEQTEQRLIDERYGRWHHVKPNGKCADDCPACERRGGTERIKFTADYESIRYRLEAAEAQLAALTATLRTPTP